MNNKQTKIYNQIRATASTTLAKIHRVQEDSQFFAVLKNFPPYLKKRQELKKIFRVAFHNQTKTLIISNVGANLISKTVKSGKMYALHHKGLIVLHPEHPTEMVDLGIVGDILRSEYIILRAESACTPSFLMGSQRCNCFDQWLQTQELAANFNPLPTIISDATDPEIGIKNYFNLSGEMPVSSASEGQAFILMHLSSQNGMGSGAENNKFRSDTAEAAHLRHRGEYSAEQVLNVSMAGGFETIGLSPDPRKLNNFYGYQIPAIVLDYLGLEKPVIILSNNPEKIRQLEKFGFEVKTLHLFGRVDKFDRQETADRKNEFHHCISVRNINNDKELEDLEHEIRRTITQDKDHKSGSDRISSREKPTYLVGNRTKNW